MQGESVIYQGKMIAKLNFRAFIYDKNNNRKLVNSWDEYEKEMSTGDWFDNKQSPQQKQETPHFGTLKKKSKK